MRINIWQTIVKMPLKVKIIFVLFVNLDTILTNKEIVKNVKTKQHLVMVVSGVIISNQTNVNFVIMNITWTTHNVKKLKV